jgi:general secretion pathway protein G
MIIQNRKAFTMIELVFVIVVIGILSAVAIPRFAVNRDDAVVARAKSEVASIRSALATERQKRILTGTFTPIFKLSSSVTAGAPVFDAFDGNVSKPVLEYAPLSCSSTTSQECWRETTTGTVGSPISQYTFYMPVTGTVVFTLANNRFDCNLTAGTAKEMQDCKDLTQ